MNIKFILNEYILIWNFLFRQSISKELNDVKQKIWNNYKREYNALQKENINILKDPKNYIPDDDTIYNVIKEQDIYGSIYKYTNKYKLGLMEEWDREKKDIARELKSIIKTNIKDYSVYLVDPRLGVVDFNYCHGSRNNLLWGEKE